MIIRYCEVCKKQIPEERLEALPDTWRCVKCSNETKTQGVVEYGHKTAGVILILPKDSEQRRQVLRAYRRAR